MRKCHTWQDDSTFATLNRVTLLKTYHQDYIFSFQMIHFQVDLLEVMVFPKRPWELNRGAGRGNDGVVLGAGVRACFSTDRCAGYRKDPNLERVIKFVVIVNIV